MFFAPIVSRRALNGYARPYAGPAVVPAYSDSFFDEVLGNVFNPQRQSPLVEQDDKSWTLSLDVPGLAREHLAISIEANTVRIESKADAPRAVKAAYELSGEIDPAASEAKLENGVLTLKLARKAPVDNTVQLQIS